MNVEKETSTEEVNQVLKDAANEELKGILAFSEEPLVSIDFRGNPNSSIVDAENTKVIGGTAIKILSWYDNEWGYSCRVRDLVKFIAAKGLLTGSDIRLCVALDVKRASLSRCLIIAVSAISIAAPG
jgi:glyceraldehyde 3-phosphate dehydrogenase